MTFKATSSLTLDSLRDSPADDTQEFDMKTKMIGIAAALVALFTTTAVAATKVAANGGCCPFCK